MRCANRGQHGILPVMALDTPWPGAVRLYCQNAAQAVFAQIELDMTGRPGLGWRGFDQAYDAIQHGPVQAGQQVVVTNHATYPRYTQLVMPDTAATHAGGLGTGNGLNAGRWLRPGLRCLRTTTE